MIRGLAQRIDQDVKHFLDKIEKYEAKLGARAPQGFHHGTVAKLKWAQHVQEKSNELQRSVSIRMEFIKILFDLLNHQLGEEHRLFVSAEMTKQANIANRMSCDINTIGNTIKQDVQRAQVQTSNDLHHLRDECRKINASIIDRILTHNQTTRDKLAAQMSALSLDVSKGNSACKDLQCRTAKSEELQQILTILSSLQQTLAPTSVTKNEPRVSSRISFTLTIPTFTNCAHKIMWALNLAIMVCVLKLRGFLLALPHAFMAAYVMGTLPSRISTLLSDNLSFEDALGRVLSLQFQQFRHWPTFEANLRCHFADSPGLQKVLDGKFVLTSPSYPGVRLDATNWNQKVRQRMVVFMSISIESILAKPRACPRGCGVRTISSSVSESRCLDCNLLFSLFEIDLPMGGPAPPNDEPMACPQGCGVRTISSFISEGQCLDDNLLFPMFNIALNNQLGEESTALTLCTKLSYKRFILESLSLFRKSEQNELQTFKRIVVAFGRGDAMVESPSDLLINYIWRGLPTIFARILEAVDLNTTLAEIMLLKAERVAEVLNEDPCIIRPFEAPLDPQMTEIIRRLLSIYEGEGDFPELERRSMMLQTLESRTRSHTADFPE